MKYFFLIFGLFTWLSPSLWAQSRTLIHCGQLIDGQSEMVQSRKTLVISGERIVAVEDGYLRPAKKDRLIDLRDHTVLPGLMDMHVHIEFEVTPQNYTAKFTDSDADVALQASVYAKRTLTAGFTTVRDLGGSGVNISLRNAINRGIVPGPRIFTAGQAIAVTGGHGDPTNGMRQDLYDPPGPAQGVANGPDECRAAVRQQYKNGADCIKITATGGVLSVARDGFRPQFTEEEIAAIVATARDFGYTVAAHAHGAEGMKRAVRAGVTSIEHGTLMDEETMDLMIERGTYFVPTITAGRAVADSAKIPGFYPELVTPKALFIGPQIQATFAKAYQKGVKIAFGTDAAVFAHGLNALEFVYMVEGGMSPMEAIHSATRIPAEMLGVDQDLGTLEAGKIADVIAVPQDPTQDIKALQKVSFVMKSGKVYKSL
jgi:imidazolonepropionase-like amidohydrolase